MTERDLTLVGLSEDKSRLVLRSPAGEVFQLPVDAHVRAVLGGDDASRMRSGATDQTLEIEMESVLRPRDIQARIRAGETPETVAAAARTTLEKVMVFATPVLAERAHIAERAQRASVRRKAGEGPTRLLDDAVTERLRSRNVDPGSVDWDAWRRDDGRWTVVADYRSGESERHAEFTFDAPGRYVVAEDDEGRWLVGEKSASKGPQPRPTGTGAGTPRRLTAVVSDESSADDELPLGADAMDLVNAVSDPPDREKTVEIDRPGAPGDADWIATQATERPAPSDTEDPTDAEQSAKPARRAAKKSRGRSSVPSWDEIMFGGGRGD
ncbi:MAG TPA: septation protein SepH [Nocardioidaceae bacterium]|nr:septation protein SepH [Nocardioidaceae bacterium]